MIIERTLGYSNQSMIDYCESLKSVITKTREVKTVSGKNIKLTTVSKYKTDEDTLSKIINSIGHYKQLLKKEMDNSFTFRDYQEDIISQGTDIINKNGFLYLSMEVRTGKTLTSLGICSNLNPKVVLFVTKKKAVTSIAADYKTLNPSYGITIINYESLHHVVNDEKWDVIIVDEAHGLGAYAKPSIRARMIRDVIEKDNPKVILLSGTPTPESYSQMYHQVYGIPNNPFKEFKNFYRFSDVHIKVKDKKINALITKDYSHGLESILEAMKPYTISYTQKEAGFNAETIEQVLYVDIKPATLNLIAKLKRDLVIEGRDEIILADTPVKLMTKVHQLCSGTIKFESGKSMVLDTSKADFIKDYFDGCKIGIFYKFKEELNALQQVFRDNLTTELDEFDSTDKNIALQIVSGREGISLKMADYLVYYNIDFSATSYWQSKDRMTTKDRLRNNVYWIFSKGGIEDDIYKAVTKKKDYTLSHFKKTL